MTVSQTPRSPVPQEVSTELERVVRRWRQLPLDHALSFAGQVRALVQTLADQAAAATGAPPAEVPDHGPATLMDQLAVMVYDASAADAAARDATARDATARDAAARDATAPDPSAHAATSSSTALLTSTLAHSLASLRRELR